MYMSQVNGYLEQIPMLEYKKAWPIAVMIAQLGNFQGGRQKRKPKKASDSVPYKPEDFFSYMWFAQYQPYLELTGKRKDAPLGVDTETAQLIVGLNTTGEGGLKGSRLESWMIAALSDIWEEIVEKAEG